MIGNTKMTHDPEIIPDPQEIVCFLKKTVRYKDVCQKVLFQQVIDRVAQERGVTVEPDEIQAEADRLRREWRLERAVDTFAWLADHQITAEEWEAGIRDRLLAKNLAKFLFSGEVEKFFAQNRLDFEQIVLYQLIVPYEPVVRELFYRIEEGEISFYEAAHLYDIDKSRRMRCGYEGTMSRWSLKPEIAAAAFSAEIRQVVGPFQTEQGYHLMMIEEFIPAELTAEVWGEIQNKMFQEWLNGELNYLLHNQI
jgi:parvulin-like peptidyl-prolyl isomerase